MSIDVITVICTKTTVFKLCCNIVWSIMTNVLDKGLRHSSGYHPCFKDGGSTPF